MMGTTLGTVSPPDPRGAPLFSFPTVARSARCLAADRTAPRPPARRQEIERNGIEPPNHHHEVLLYVSAGSLPCARAEATLRELLRKYPPEALCLRVIDVANDIPSAERDRIVYTPTLICRGTRGDTRVLGDLSNANVLVEVLYAMGIEPL